MKTFSVLTLFPEMVEASLKEGVVGRAFAKGLLRLNLVSLRDFAEQDVHKAVDDRPYGGGDGMVMMPEPLSAGVRHAKSLANSSQTKVIYLSPQGRRLDQTLAKQLSETEHLVILSGRYAGVDERLIQECVDEEISIGDYVLSGGELAAAVLIDVVARCVPGVLGHKDSVEKDSLNLDGLLEAPLFTRPRVYESMEVPEILLSGDHKKIDRFRHLLSIYRTFKKRPDLWTKAVSSNSELENDLEEAKLVLRSLSAPEKRSCGLEESL